MQNSAQHFKRMRKANGLEIFNSVLTIDIAERLMEQARPYLFDENSIRWNKWLEKVRRDYPDFRPSFDWVKAFGQELYFEGFDFSHSNWHNLHSQEDLSFVNCDLDKACFQQITFENRLTFTDCSIKNANFKNFQGGDMSINDSHFHHTTIDSLEVGVWGIYRSKADGLLLTNSKINMIHQTSSQVNCDAYKDNRVGHINHQYSCFNYLDKPIKATEPQAKN